MKLTGFKSVLFAAVAAAGLITASSALADDAVQVVFEKKSYLVGTLTGVTFSDNLVRGKVPETTGSEYAKTDHALVTNGSLDLDASGNVVHGKHMEPKKGMTLTWNLQACSGDRGCDIESVVIYSQSTHQSYAWVNLAKISYTTADEPEVWKDLEGSGVDFGSENGSARLSVVKVYNYLGRFLLRNVCQIRLTVSTPRAGENQWTSIGEVEVFGVSKGAFTLQDVNSGSAYYAGSSPVKVDDFPQVEGMTEYCLSATTNAPDAGASWKAVPADGKMSLAFTADGVAKDVHTFAFLRAAEDSPAEEWLMIQSSTLRYTDARPTASCQTALVRSYFEGDSLTLSGADFDNGSVGGTDPGDESAGIAAFEVPIERFELSIKSGPTMADLDEDPTTVTVATPGDYTLEWTLVSAAGFKETREVTAAVTEVSSSTEVVWTGAVSDNWLEPANWNPVTAPVAGRKLRVPSDCAQFPRLSGVNYPSAGSYASLTVDTGARIVCEGDKDFDRGPWIAADEMVINGTIDAKGMGYLKDDGEGHGSGAGSSYGGFSLFDWTYFNISNTSGGKPYGDAREPTRLGSGCHNVSTKAAGGAVKLVSSGTITVNGTVTADAEDDGISSGGSVWIVCDTLSGTGRISATGGKNGVSGYASAGGRIALEYETKTFSGLVTAAPSPGVTSGNHQAAPGTLWEPKRYPVGTPEERAEIVEDGANFFYVFPDRQPRYWTLRVTGAGHLGFVSGRINVPEISLAGSTALSFDRWCGLCEIGSKVEGLTNVTLAGSAKLMLSGSALQPQYDLDVLSIGTQARLYFGLCDSDFVNEASGGTEQKPFGRGVRVNVSGDMTLDGIISLDCVGSVKPESHGFVSTTGAGHGGASLTVQGANRYLNAAYGSISAPTEPGCPQIVTATQIGGGAIELCVAGQLTVNGSITANGRDLGSGGSVWIRTTSLAGAGSLSARAATASSGYAGAGGRIAIEAERDAFTGTLNVNGHYGSNRAWPGTVFRSKGLVVSADGLSGSACPQIASVYSTGSVDETVFEVASSDDVTGEALVAERNMTVCKPEKVKFAWTERMYLQKKLTAVPNTVTYTISDLAANTKYRVTHNGVARKVKTDAEGKLVFSAEFQNGLEPDSFVVDKTGLVIMFQ